jgi:hypothetical protein
MTDEAEVPEHQTRVYRYRVMTDLPQEAVDELRRAHELSNRLIEIERAHADRVAEVWREVPDLVALEGQVQDADDVVAELVALARKERMTNRSTNISPELKRQLSDARKLLREAKTAFRDKKGLLYPVVKPKLAKLGTDRRSAIKATYRPAVDDGLYWANYNATVQRHEVAVKAVRSARKMGRPSDLRFRRWTGEGTLVVQLQRQAHQPPRTPAMIGDPAGYYRNVVQLTPVHDPEQWETMTRPERRRARSGMLRFRIGADNAKGWVEVPVLVHRPIPADADICMMEIKRERQGRKYQIHVSVVVRLPVTPARTEGPPVAMHVGWRALPDRSIRVAVVSGVTAPVPPDFADVIRPHGDWAEIVVPAAWRDRLDYVHGIASQRGRSLDTLRVWFTKWLAENPDHTIAGVETVERWRSPNRFAALAKRIRDDVSVPEEVRTQLEAWRVQDQHLWEIEAHLRAKILARRNDAYANVAVWALDTAGLLLVDNYKITSVARKPDITSEDPEAHRAARANRVLAAPGRLRLAMVDGARRRGIQVQPIDGRISKLHATCGTELDDDEREASVMVWCPACQTMVDQDANALELLRSRM